jgi:hypothetical protein
MRFAEISFRKLAESAQKYLEGIDVSIALATFLRAFMKSKTSVLHFVTIIFLIAALLCQSIIYGELVTPRHIAEILLLILLFVFNVWVTYREACHRVTTYMFQHFEITILFVER